MSAHNLLPVLYRYKLGRTDHEFSIHTNMIVRMKIQINNPRMNFGIRFHN